jgi:hypothetical protein
MPYLTAFAGKIKADTRCRLCGHEFDLDDCAEITAFGEARPRYVPTKVCPTPGCGTTCPICHRPEGDVHSGECGSIILPKLVDQVYVTRDDCRIPRRREDHHEAWT